MPEYEFRHLYSGIHTRAPDSYSYSRSISLHPENPPKARFVQERFFFRGSFIRKRVETHLPNLSRYLLSQTFQYLQRNFIVNSKAISKQHSFQILLLHFFTLGHLNALDWLQNKLGEKSVSKIISRNKLASPYRHPLKRAGFCF